MIKQNTRESAIRRDEFHQVLQSWLDESFDNQVGDAEHHAGPAWLWVRHGGEHFYLHASSTRSGVREYLRLVADADTEVDWQTEHSGSAVRDRVAVGPAGAIIEGFELYRHVPRR
jgi:hypothetical protein